MEVIVSNFGEFQKYYDILEEYLQQYSEEGVKKYTDGIKKNSDEQIIYDEYRIFTEEYMNILREKLNLIVPYRAIAHPPMGKDNRFTFTMYFII